MTAAGGATGGQRRRYHSVLYIARDFGQREQNEKFSITIIPGDRRIFRIVSFVKKTHIIVAAQRAVTGRYIV